MENNLQLFFNVYHYIPVFLHFLFAFGKDMCYIWKTFKTKADMIEKLDYAMVPTGFAHCFNGNCKQADHCLRHPTVRQVFLSNGVKEEPAFDSWQTGYRWTKG